MATDKIEIERKENGYLVRFAEYISTKEFVFATLAEALQKAAYQLDYRFEGEVRFPGDGWKDD